MANKDKLIAGIWTDRHGRGASRHAEESAELYVRPLVYGDLSEVSVTVWADGMVHLTIKDKTGAIVSSHHYDPLRPGDPEEVKP